MTLRNGSKELWMGIGKQILSFIVGVVVAAFILGRNSQKINDVVVWKNEMAPRIERMDSKGTLSFEIFHIQYVKEQAQQYARLEKLENRLSGFINPERINKMADDLDYIKSHRWGEERLQELYEDTKEINVLKVKIEALERERQSPPKL